MKTEFGDLIELKLKKETLEGVLIPSSKTEIIFLKLKNGYNIGINKKDILKTKVIKKYKEIKSKKSKITQDKNLPTISILHTGGTIASRVDYRTGGVLSKFNPEDLIEMFPELKQIAKVKSKLISNMWSDDLRFSHFNKIAKEIKKEVIKGAEGIIVTMGTDNLAVASAALAFILEELPVPVLFVGAQRSSDRGSSDAGMNLITATQFIVNSDFAEVAICMHKNTDDDVSVILSATKSRKLHSSRRDAFKAVNSEPFAEVEYPTGKIKYINKNYKKKGNKNLKLKLFNEKLKIGLLKAHVNMYPEEFSLYKKWDGLVIEGTGLGHIPLDVLDIDTKVHDKIKNLLFQIIKSGTLVAMTTQTLFGRTGMNVYSKGRDLQGLGVLGNNLDMLPEVMFIKLAWLLSNYKKQEIPELLAKNLRGEINERLTDFDIYL